MKKGGSCGRGLDGPRLSVVSEQETAVAPRPRSQNATADVPVVAGGASPVKVAAEAERAAAARVQHADGAVGIAQAKLAEARAKAPQHGPVLQLALDAASDASTRVVAARLGSAEAIRAVADAAGAVEVAKAKREDLDTKASATPGQFVAADEAIARTGRARQAAQDAVGAARALVERETKASVAADGFVQEARHAPDVKPWQVVAAQEAARAAQQNLSTAQVEHAAATAELAAVRQKAAAGDPAAQEKQQHFFDLEEFVVDYVLPNWERRLAADQGPQLRWCAHWWEHLEVATRLGHVWEAFEVMRREQGPAMSTFWRDHVDHHMGGITDTSGPFQMCDDAGAHELLPGWRTVPAPAGLFPSNEGAETETERRELIRKHTAATAAGEGESS